MKYRTACKDQGKCLSMDFDNCQDAIKYHARMMPSQFPTVEVEIESSDDILESDPSAHLPSRVTLESPMQYIQKTQDKIMSLKTLMAESKYHFYYFSQVSELLSDIRKDVYVQMQNIALGMVKAKGIKDRHPWLNVMPIFDEINKLDDAISYFVFVYDNIDENRMDGWQHPKQVGIKLRDIFNTIEDCFLYISSNIKYILEDEKIPNEMEFGLQSYPSLHLLDVVVGNQWGKFQVLHKAQCLADANAFLEFYRSLNPYLGVTICEPLQYNLENFLHSKEVRIPKRKAFPDAFKKTLHKWQDGKCACCKDKFPIKKMHKDHVMPLASGGMDQEANIQLLCKECNLTKSMKPIHNAHLYEIVMKKRESR